MDNNPLPTSSGCGPDSCAACELRVPERFVYWDTRWTCRNEQNKEVFMAWTQNLIEEKCAELRQQNFYLIRTLHEMIISDKEYKKKNTQFKQNMIDLNKKLSEYEYKNAQLEQNNIDLKTIIRYEEYKQKHAALKNQVAQAKMRLQMENKNRRSEQEPYFPQQRHSQQEDNSHLRDTPPQLQSYHWLSQKKPQQREEVTSKHSDLQGQPEQQPERNDTHVQYMAQNVQGDIQPTPHNSHTDSAHSSMAVGPSGLDCPCAAAAEDMAKYFPEEQKRKVSDMEESATEQNYSQDHVGAQTSVVATKRPKLEPENDPLTPNSPQEVSKELLQPVQLIGSNKTPIPKALFNAISFTKKTASRAARKLLVICFERDILGRSSLTGKKSPTFKDKPLKEALDPLIVADIVETVAKRCEVSEKEVRAAITAKCADENKMWRKRQEALSKTTDKENLEL